MTLVLSPPPLPPPPRAAFCLPQVVEALLDRGALIDRPGEKIAEGDPDTIGATPLIWAARKGKHRVLRLLLERGADDTYVDPGGRDALAWAREQNYVEAIQASPSKDEAQPKNGRPRRQGSLFVSLCLAPQACARPRERGAPPCMIAPAPSSWRVD